MTEPEGNQRDIRPSNPFSVVDWAAKTVRAAGWIKPILALAVVAAFVLRLFPSLPAAISAIFSIFVLMILFFGFAQLSSRGDAVSRFAAKAVMWLTLLVFASIVSLSISLMTQRAPVFLANLLRLPQPFNYADDPRNLIKVLVQSKTLPEGVEITPILYDDIKQAEVFVITYSRYYCVSFPKDGRICDGYVAANAIASNGVDPVITSESSKVSSFRSNCPKTVIANISENKMPVVGIDISRVKGDLDLGQFADQKVAFVIIRSGQGARYVDPNFEKYWISAGASGMLRGAYHIFTDDDTSEQILAFKSALSKIDLDTCDLGTALDLSDYFYLKNPSDPRKRATEALRWLKAIENATGRKPIIYLGSASGRWLYSNKDLWKDFSGYPVWWAQYSKPLRLPPDRKSVTFWQTSDGAVGEIPPQLQQLPKLDVNIFNGTPADLALFLRNRK